MCIYRHGLCNPFQWKCFVAMLYGFKNVFGNIYKDKLLDIIIKKRNTEISSLLRDGGIHSILDNKQNNVSMDDICDSCNCYFEAYRRGGE